MRPLLLALALFAAILPASAEHFVTPEDAAGKVGSELKVRGKCVQASQSSKGDIYLNFGSAYPNQTFYAFIAAKDIEQLGGHKFLLASEGQVISVHGVVQERKGKAFIAVSQPLQLAQ